MQLAMGLSLGDQWRQKSIAAGVIESVPESGLSRDLTAAREMVGQELAPFNGAREHGVGSEDNFRGAPGPQAPELLRARA